MIVNALLAVLLAAPPAASEGLTPESPAVERNGDAGRWRWDHAKVGVFGGAFDGVGVRKDSGGAAVLEARATPVRKGGGWKLEFPLRFHHLQTFGASLSETFGSAYAGAERRLARGFHAGVNLGLSGAWRPSWPDLYQPDPAGTGALARTDRYSYVAYHAGVSVNATPMPRNHLHFRYEYVHYGYTRDPAFDQATRPMHLTPRDNGQHQLEVAWRVIGDGYTAAARIDYAHRLDEVYLARDALNGSTNGGTNPFQKIDRLEPSVELNLKRLGDRLDLSLRYGYQIQNDLFAGYYSYSGHHPRVAVGYAFTDRFSVRAKGEAWLFEYGPNSKASNLKSGTRLYKRKTAAGVTASYALTDRLSAQLTGEWVKRDTNYPDYVPLSYPSATSLYSIQWNYVNTALLAGVEYRL